MPTKNRSTFVSESPNIDNERKKLTSLYENIKLAQTALDGYESQKIEVNTLSSKVEALQNQIQELTLLEDRAKSEYVKAVSFFDEENRENRAKLDQVKALIGKCKSQIEFYEDVESGLRLKVNSLEGIVAGLMIKEGEFQDKKAGYTSQLTLLSEEISSKEKTLEGLTALLEELEKKHSKLRDKISDASRQISDKISQSNLVAAEIADLEGKKQTIQQEINNATTEFHSYRQSRKQALDDQEKSISERLKDIAVREQWVDTTTAKLQRHKINLEKFYGKRFEDLML